jgi:hypothetical protein
MELLEYSYLIPEEFGNQSKVWLFQANRPLQMSEALDLEVVVENFVAQWQSHGTPVKGYGNLLFGRFLVFMADEANLPSGCSTDGLMRIVQELEKILPVKFTDRTQLAFIKNNKIEAIPLNQLNYALEHNIINGETLFIDNTITNKYDLLHNWIIPVKTSWIAKRYPHFFSGN